MQQSNGRASRSWTQPCRSVAVGLLTLAVLLLARTPSAGRLGDALFGVSPAEYASRRAAVRAAAQGAIVLLRAPSEQDDIERERYRTDNDFMYLTGVEAPGAWLALLPPQDPSGRTEILFLPNVSPRAARWTDPVLAPGEAARGATGIAAVESTTGMWEALGPSVARSSAVYLGKPAGDTASSTDPSGPEARLRSLRAGIEIRSAGRLVHPLRWRKSAAEVGNLRAAISATEDAERGAGEMIAPGVAELAVEGAILDAFRRGGAAREGFPCIVGSGPNSTILHHFSGPRQMLSGDMVVVDIGAEYNYYSADLTRTFPCGGHFTPRQRELYRLVLDTQRACEKCVVPGQTTLGDVQRMAVATLRNSSLRARDANGMERTMNAFFVHSIGHWLGMDVHDVGGDSSVLEPGVVFTIEPGVYLQSEGIGIRIEDDYLVTRTGVEKLSRDLPSDPAAIEAMMAHRSSSRR